MALQTHFLEIYLAILCINAGIYVVDDLSGNNLVTPFTNANVTAVAPPGLFNSTNNTDTLTSNFTNTGVLSNGTIGASNPGTVNPVDTILYPITLLYIFLQLLTGGFIWSTLAIFGLPAALVFVMQGIIGLLLAVTIVYYLTGR